MVRVLTGSGLDKIPDVWSGRPKVARSAGDLVGTLAGPAKKARGPSRAGD